MTQAIPWIPTSDVPPLGVPTRSSGDGWPQLVRTLAGELSPDKLFEQICRDVVAGFGFSRSILATVDERNHRLVARAGYDPNLRTQAYMALVRLFQIPLAPRSDGRYLLAAWCVHRQEQAYVPDARTACFRPDEVTQRPFVIKALGTTEYVLTPVVFRGRTVAVLGVDKKGRDQRITAGERQLLVDIAALLALRMGPLLDGEEHQRRARTRDESAGRGSWLTLLRSFESLRALLDGLDEGLIVVSGDQIVQYANAPAATLLGVDHDELTGQRLQDVLRLVRPDAFAGLLSDARSRGHSLRKRERLIAPSGDEYDVQLRVMPVLVGLEAQAIFLLAGGDRVHHRRFQDEVFRTALHDLLAPIQSIVGFAELLQAGRLGQLSTEQAEFVSRIAGGGEELIAFVERLMTVQNLESRDRQPDNGTVGAASVVKRVVSGVEGKALRAGVQVVHDLNGELPPLRGDESRLKAVFQNVLDNAIDATEPGGTVRLTASVHDDPRYVRFSVTEAGPTSGVHAPDMLSYDEDWTRTGAGRKRRSHGLGLTIVRRVVEGYGGEVWAQGEDEGELSITFTLPRASEPADAALIEAFGE